MKEERKKQGRALVMPQVEPWPEAVNPLDVANDILDNVRRYVRLPEGGDVGIVLWLMHAYVFDAFCISPILAITSPERRCGKTTLISVLAELANRPLVASNVTTSVLFRAIEMYAPTIFIDEADTFFRTNRELVGVVNSGQNRAGAYVLRGTGEDFEPRAYSTWAPKVVAGIRNMPPTIEDRAVVIRMRRRLPSEKVERLRLDRTGAFEIFRRKLKMWALQSAEALREADPEVPGALNDRAADNWRPLLAIADLIGDRWPEEARQAALLLSAAGEPEESPEFRMLCDVWQVFRDRGVSRVATADLQDLLHSFEDAPWKDWAEGSGLTPHTISTMLKTYGVKSVSVSVGGRTRRGYKLEDFSDAFRRYVTAEVREAREARVLEAVRQQLEEERDLD